MASQPTLDDLVAKVTKLDAQRLALRDVVARLLAYVADKEGDLDIVLRNFFESGDARIDKKEPTSPGWLELAETSRKEKDWIVNAARKILQK